MPAVLLLLFCLLLLPICRSSEDSETINAVPGQNVTLNCSTGDIPSVIVLEWSRDDFDDKKVFVFKDGRPYPAAQHEFFRNRVSLEDPQMKNGNLSVVLKNVTNNDTGTYKCRVLQRAKRSIMYSSPISTIHLHVPLPPPPPPGEKGEQEGGHGGNKAGGSYSHAGLTVLTVLAVVLGIGFGFYIFKKKTTSNQSSKKQQHPEEDLLNSDCKAGIPKLVLVTVT